MQWVALDEKQDPVLAPHAIKQKRYLCPECLCFVQLRSGPHRQPHFYHTQAHPTCAQHKKTQEHLGLQLILSSQLPLNESRIERPFPQIQRIADVAWETRKIVFEIQCSPISYQEAFTRCQDYRSIGWETLWILSDKQFNKKKLSAAERYLREQTSYFSHWDKNSLIYDQCEILKDFQRVFKGPPVPINPLLTLAHSSREAPVYALPICLKERCASWKLRVEKDVISQVLAGEPPWIKGLLLIENRLKRHTVLPKRLPWYVLLQRCYIQVLKKILHRVCLRDL